ncbi:MAG TPA: hypothetical protein VGO96_02430 [Pyrinomonadaceae bacterium]|jgi:hypothetical protein|nr:hypothetical protein [Pyrinomonadaceae bacterium]
MTETKRKYRGIEDLYEAEEQMRQKPVLISTSLPDSNSPKTNSLSESDSHPEINRLPKPNIPESNSLPIQQATAYQNNSPLDSNSLPKSNSPQLIVTSTDSSLDLMASLPDVGGFTKFWHQLTDYLYGQLTPAEQVVHIQLFRLSWGHNKSSCKIGLPQLARRAGIGRSTAQIAVAGLINKGLIKKVQTHFGSDKEQGNEYYVVPPSSMLTSSNQSKRSSLPESNSLPESRHNKENTYKESTQTQDAPAASVRVGSKFTLEECRRYAKHLQSTGQGINNPGGYATTIHRTGEADLLIESFLHPEATASPSANLDTSECPDCNGTGFYYPQGVEGGVSRCKHQRLGREGE